MQAYENSLFIPSLQSLAYLSSVDEGPFDFSLLKSSAFNIEQREDFAQCSYETNRAFQQQRTPFQNISNCMQLDSHQTHQQSHHLKAPLLFTIKPSLKDKSPSQQIKENQAEALFDDTAPLMKQSKGQNMVLAQDLQNKMKQLDEKLSQKIKTIKQQFWQQRSKSLRTNENASRRKEVKGRLIDHLNKKPMNNDCHQHLKECYLKFIPMRQILTHEGEPIKNQKILHSKFEAHFSAQLKL